MSNFRDRHRARRLDEGETVASSEPSTRSSEVLQVSQADRSQTSSEKSSVGLSPRVRRQSAQDEGFELSRPERHRTDRRRSSVADLRGQAGNFAEFGSFRIALDDLATSGADAVGEDTVNGEFNAELRGQGDRGRSRVFQQDRVTKRFHPIAVASADQKLAEVTQWKQKRRKETPAGVETLQTLHEFYLVPTLDAVTLINGGAQVAFGIMAGAPSASVVVAGMKSSSRAQVELSAIACILQGVLLYLHVLISQTTWRFSRFCEVLLVCGLNALAPIALLHPLQLIGGTESLSEGSTLRALSIATAVLAGCATVLRLLQRERSHMRRSFFN